MLSIAGAVVAVASLLAAQDVPADKIHVRIAKKVAPATVYVEGGGERGSGVIIDKSGLILTSPTACGTTSTTVTVFTQGAKTYRGKVMGRANDLEMVLVKIDVGAELPFVELGDSDRARAGQITYVFGDSFDSIRTDDQAAMSLGVVSGIYELQQKHGRSVYMGPVIETSAAVNPNQDGGPLVDREGKLLGIVTLNYDDSKFTGLAVPVNRIKPAIERIRREYESKPVVIEPAARKPTVPAAKAPEPTPAGSAWLGLEVKAVEGGLEVTRVSRKSPAEKAGIRRGDLVTAIDGKPADAEEALRKALDARSAGDSMKLSAKRDGDDAVRVFVVPLASRPVY